jgi:hypothetical protein
MEPPHKSQTAKNGNIGPRRNSFLGTLSNSIGAIVAKNNTNTSMGLHKMLLS